ncbi:MAG: Crp/Fnr family transcriptional regulator [Parcubacteria group bacterium]|nr:Crp/Fnr family transcriptional regulator [Parcubacteria group bacterium]
MQAFWHLKQIDIFSDIPDKEIKQLLSKASDECFHTKQTIYTPTDLQKKIFLVKTGEVTLFQSKGGRRIIIDIVGPGTLFGALDPSVLTLDHFAQAAPDTRICGFATVDFLQLISSYPGAMLCTLKQLSQRIADYEHAMIVSHGEAKERVLEALKRYVRKMKPFRLFSLGSPCARLTHEKLSQLTGLNRVTVTRVIQDLVKEGIIEVDAQSKEICF